MGSNSQAAGTKFDKVMIIILENTNYSVAIQQKFLTEFAKMGASLTNMTALVHPSQGNYISMISGDTFGIRNDNNIDLTSTHIGDLLEAKGLTWKVYAEDYPGNCFLGASQGRYVRKHVPFLSFKNVSTNPARCKNIVSANRLDQDITAHELPNYSLFIPNMQNDGHNTGVAFADKWLSKRFGPLLKDPKFMDGMLVVITFDESDSAASNKIYTAVFGDSVISESTSKKAYTHYSILKTIENNWNLGTLNKSDVTASPINDVLK